MKKFISFAFICAFAVLLNAGELKFMAAEQVSYDDNIYLSSKDKVDSFISSTKLGAFYEGQVPNSSLKGQFSAIGGYNAYTEKNSKNGYWDALVSAELSNNNFTIGDRFILTSDQANAELTQRAKRINNTAYASYITSREKMFSLGFKVADIYNRYLKSDWEGLNRNRLDLSAGAYYNLSSKTSLFAEYTYTDIDYDKNKDNNSDGGIVALGVEGQISSKVKGIAKATYNYRNYDHSLPGIDNYADLFGYEVSLSWEPTSKDLLTLSGTRTFEETLYENNRFFIDTGVKLYASHKVKEKLTLALTLAYDNLSYKTENWSGKKRSDDVYSLRPEVLYQFKEWLSAGVWYQFRKRTSNVDTREYDNNRAGVFVKAFF